MTENKEKKVLTFYEKLTELQNKLNVPKLQQNKYGGFNYRSCEDILEAVKPLLKEYKMSLTIKDELVLIGARYYVKAIVTLGNLSGSGQETVTAYAREEEVKKGMDGSQITGASSSYARKYALNGLFLIDDAKDSDATSDGKQKAKPVESKTITPEITANCEDCGVGIPLVVEEWSKKNYAGKKYCRSCQAKHKDEATD